MPNPTQTLLFQEEETKIAKIMYTEGVLLLQPDTKRLRKFLTIRRRKIGGQPITAEGTPDWSKEREIVWIDEEMFIPLSGNTLQTYPGFRHSVVDFYRQEGFAVEVHDLRIPFPEPQLQHARGFRGNQEEKFMTLVNAGESGGLEAPTRWGKSTIIRNLLRVFPNLPTVVAAPGTNLLRQTCKELSNAFPDRTVELLVGSRKKGTSGDITVTSMDSLHKTDAENTRLLIIDEPHTIASEERFEQFSRFVNARRYAVGASWQGRFDKADKIIEAIVGPILSRTTYTEAVLSGNICPIRVYIIQIPFRVDAIDYKKRHTCVKSMVLMNPYMHWLGSYLSSIVPADWQTILFVEQEKQADAVAALLPGAKVAMDKKFKSPKEAAAMQDKMVKAEIMRCVATSIYSTGLTFSELRVMINLCSGGGSITSVQKPGRLAEIRPGKKRGYVFDYQFVPVFPKHLNDTQMRTQPWYNGKWRAMVADCWGRRKTYDGIGYEIVEVPLVQKENGFYYPDETKIVLE